MRHTAARTCAGIALALAALVPCDAHPTPIAVRGVRLAPTPDHRAIGRRFIVTAVLFTALAGALAVLAGPRPAADALGSSLMLLLAVPLVHGVALEVVPLLIGARGFALPRLAGFSYLTYLLGGLLLFGAVLADDGGWLHRGGRILAAISALAAAANLLATV